jgi:hypothetical protein
MPRLPLGDIEEALRDPRAYRQKLDTPEVSYFGPSYMNAQRFAIFHYHKVQDRQATLWYFAQMLDRWGLTNPSRRGLAEEQLEWYFEAYRSGNLRTFRTQHRVAIDLAARFGNRITCSGEITRLDLAASGYAAWLLSANVPDGWMQELRIPLLQGAVAKSLDAATAEVSIGIIALAEQRMVYHTFDSADISRAERDLTRLIAAMGY